MAWKVFYEDGRCVERGSVDYEKLEWAKLNRFQLVDGKKVLFETSVERNEELFFRKRVTMKPNGEVIRSRWVVCKVGAIGANVWYIAKEGVEFEEQVPPEHVLSWVPIGFMEGEVERLRRVIR